MAKRGTTGRSGAGARGKGTASKGAASKGTPVGGKRKNTSPPLTKAQARAQAAAKAASKKRFDEPAPTPTTPRTFRLGTVPGTTPGTWISKWRERMPQVPLELVHLSVAGQRAALTEGMVDAALIRLPVDRDDLNIIALYDEVAVVVMSIDSALSAVDELDPADVAGEVVIVPKDDALGPLDLPETVTPSFGSPTTTADAIDIAASGVGIVIVPMSLARAHQRRDVTFRPLRGGPASTIAYAWSADSDNPDVDTFMGIVRGRTANSSR